MNKLFLTLTLLCSLQAVAMDEKEKRELSDEFNLRAAVKFNQLSSESDEGFEIIQKFNNARELVFEEMLIEKAAKVARLKYGQDMPNLHMLTVDELERLKKDPRSCIDNCCLATFYRGKEDSYFINKADERAVKILRELQKPQNQAPRSSNKMD